MGLLPNSPLLRAFLSAHEPRVSSTRQGQEAMPISKSIARALADNVAQTDRSPESSPERATPEVIDNGFKTSKRPIVKITLTAGPRKSASPAKVAMGLRMGEMCFRKQS